MFGGPTPQLRWTHNGSEIVGAKNTSLTFETVARADEGIYSVVATNTAGRTTNAPMTVIVSNVEPLRFAGFEWQIDPTGPYALEETQALGANANWQALTNYSETERTLRFVELNPHPATRFYRLNGANTSRFTKASIMNGWWFTNAVGSEHLIEYVAEPTGWANWQVLTNLTLPTSPYLFIDPESLDKPGRIYRTTRQ